MARQRVARCPQLLSAALLILGAGAIHLSGAPQQLPRSIIVAAGLCLVGWVQAAGAVALLSIARRPLVRALALFCAGSVFIWGVAHSVGLPLGSTLWRPEALSIPDFFLPTMEAAAALLLVRAGWGRQHLTPRLLLRVLATMPAVLLTSALAAAGVIDAVNDAWLPASASLNVPAGQTTTLAYCSPGGSPLAMDLTMPAASIRRPVPMVVNTRSAGWFYADRQTSGLGALLWQDGRELNQALAEQGFAVASIDIRQVPLHPWPAPIEDAKCAVRFLRAHAAELGIDAEHIGAYGTSGGGNLAALLGTTDASAGFDLGEYLDQSSHVQAVVDMYGPTELTRMDDSTRFGQLVVQLSFGDSEALREGGSPIEYVSPDSAAFLILHGADDQLVRPHHSQDLAQRLQAAGVPVSLVVVQGTGHSMETPGQQPSPAAVRAMCVDFFGRALAPGRFPASPSE
ncbi:MAG: alpha/beta hydrolase [Chloroflexota bacterium]